MENQKTPYLTPQLEPQPHFVQTTGISIPIGTGLPNDFGLDSLDIPGDTQ